MGVFCVLSLETGGPNEGDIFAIGMMKIVDGEIGDKFVSLVCPPTKNAWFAEPLGLTWRDVRDFPSLANLWPHVTKFMDGADAFVAHDAFRVRESLHAACGQFRLSAPKAPFYCTAKGARTRLALPGHELADACGLLGIPMDKNGTLAKARACAEIFLALLRQGVPLEDMRIADARAKRAH